EPASLKLEITPTVLQTDGPRTDSQSLGLNDRLQIADRLIEAITMVDDHVVVLTHPLQLALGRGQPNPTFLEVLGSARSEPRTQLVQRGRSQEDADRVGQFPTHGAGALDVRRQ